MTATGRAPNLAEADGVEPQRLALDAEPKVARWSRLFGVRPSRAYVEIGADGDLVARFGPWVLRTPVSNVVAASVTGPYKAWKVAGPARLSLADRGLTFATSTGPGVCLSFGEPVGAIDPFGLVRHPALTVTVAEPERLCAALGHLPDAVPVINKPPVGTLRGGLGALRSWWRRRRVAPTRQRTVARVDVPDDASTPRPDGQPIQSGVGPVFHRTYRIVVRDSQLSPKDLMARIQSDLNLITDIGLAPFVKDRGANGSMAVGDRYTVRLAGPWDGPVEVVAVTPTSFRLATLTGHMEAGAIDFRVEPDGDRLSFVIESWARSGDSAFDALYDKLQLGKAVQGEMWVIAAERVADLTAGTALGPVEVTEEREEPSDLAG